MGDASEEEAGGGGGKAEGRAGDSGGRRKGRAVFGERESASHACREMAGQTRAACSYTFLIQGHCRSDITPAQPCARTSHSSGECGADMDSKDIAFGMGPTVAYSKSHIHTLGLVRLPPYVTRPTTSMGM